MDVARAPNGTFQPGQSGNPGGKPKNGQDVVHLARTFTRKAIYRLGDMLDDPRYAVPAAVALLDRGWGKPLQTVAAADADSPIILHLLAARVAGVALLEQQPAKPDETAQDTARDVVDLNAPPPKE